MSIINKLKSLFAKKKYRRPDINMDLEVTPEGRLIKWTNNPFQMMERRIVSGSNDKKKFTFLENTYRL